MSTVIINNTDTIDSDVIRLNGLVQYFPDPDKAGPLSNAKLYFGLVGEDPTIESNQKLVYIKQENGTVAAIPQPVRTTAGGVPTYNNSPVTLAVAGSFSFKCLDQSDVQKYYSPLVEGMEAFNSSGSVKEEKAGYTGSSTFTFQFIECTTASFYKSSTTTDFFDGVLLLKDVDYRVVSPTQIQLLGVVVSTDEVLGKQADIAGSGDSNLAKGDNVYSQATITDAKAIDFDLGDSVQINGKDTATDGLGGKYIAVEGATGVTDNQNFIDLDNGLQLQLIGSNRKLIKYVDTSVTALISNGTLTIDLMKGPAQKVTLSEGVTSLSILNKNPTGRTTFDLEVVQGATLFNLTWPSTIRWAGGVAPTITQASNKRDRFGFISNGDNWDGVIVGQDWA